MKAAIDAAGRIIVPKAIRRELALTPGQELQILARDGVIVLEPLPTPVSLVQRGNAVVAKPKGPMPKLTQQMVRDALEGARR